MHARCEAGEKAEMTSKPYLSLLFLYTKMRNVGGIAQTEAQKSSDMFAKCQYLDELTGGKGITFATGTPISNSMTEMYTNMRYLQYNRLKELGLEHFDSWAAAFGETITAIELSPEGNGYRAKTRFARFFNLPELLAVFKEVADIKTADMLDLDTPEAVYENVITKPSAYQKEILQSLAERAEKVRNREVEPYQDNMLKITNDGRKLALDQRLLNEMLPEDENSKIAACAHKIYEIWERTKEEKSAQLLFSDLSTPKGKVSVVVDGENQEAEIFENAYVDIQKKLTAMGVPAEEIAFIHQANTETQKAELFAKVRSGQIRILLGSTSKMGAGTNVQDRLIALHHLDVPWRPSDIEQREGRIIRQGNENDKVYIYRYITENTFDAYSWQTIENKQKFISQIMTSKAPVRSCEDIDESALTYAEVKALAAGNPYIKEKMTLDNDVAKLKALKANHTSQIYNLEDRIVKYYPEKLAALKEKEAGCQKDIECYRTNFPISKDVVSMELFGECYTDKKAAGEALLAAFKKLPESDEWCPIGKYAGFDIELKFTSYCLKYEMKLKNVNQLQIELGRDAGGNLIRMNNALASLPERLQTIQQELENTQNQLEQAKAEVKRPFAKEAELQEKMARLRELDAMLNMDQKEDSKNKQEEQAEEQLPEEEGCWKQPEVENREEKPSIHTKLRAYQSFVQKNGNQQPEAECPKRQAVL